MNEVGGSASGFGVAPDWGPSQLFVSMGHAVIATDLSGTVRYWNPAAERLYGWTSVEAVGRTVIDLTVPEMSQEAAGEIMDTLRSGGYWSGVFTVKRKDGSMFPALVTDSGIYDEAEELVGIVGVSVDLSRAVQPLLGGSSDATLVLNRDVRVAYVSPAAGPRLGWTDEVALGASPWDLIHPEDREEAMDYHRRIVDSAERVTLPLLCRVVLPDRSVLWMEVTMADRLDDPAVQGVVCNFRDVTEQRQLVILTGQLQGALNTRVVIEQAKGMIARDRSVDVDEAFQLLRRHARAHNKRVRDTALAIVALELRL